MPQEELIPKEDKILSKSSWMHLLHKIVDKGFGSKTIRCKDQESLSGHNFGNGPTINKVLDNGDMVFIVPLYCQYCGKYIELQTSKVSNKVDMIANHASNSNPNKRYDQ